MPVKPPGYWKDFAALERELLAFVDEHGTPGVMPTNQLMRRAGRHDLMVAIQAHGGMAAVAERLGQDHRAPHRPHNYWRNPDNLERELLAFIAEHGEPGVMPKQTAIVEAGRPDLAVAITRGGGYHAAAERLGLQRPDARRPANQWADFAALERELRAFVAEPDRPQRMPTYGDLRAVERYDLCYAVQRYGGTKAVAKRLGWETVSEQARGSAGRRR
jgi:hypothetical protein